jgi:aminopeptidase N
VAAAADAAAALVAADDLVAAYVLAWGGVLGAAADFARRGEQHLQALMLTLPSDVELLNGYAADECLDAAAVASAKRTLLGALAQSVGAAALSTAYRTARLDPSAPYALTPDAEGRRALSLVLLDLWLRADEASGSIGESPREGGSALAALVAHCEEAQNLTDRAGALRLLANVEEEAPRVKALAAYDAEFGLHREAIDEWFTAQALSALPRPAPRLLALMQHPAFSLANPNKVRAVFGGLATGAPAVLQDPQVLSLLGDVVALVDATNGNLAASLAKMLAQWRRWPAGAAQDGAKAVLERVRDRPGCSKNAEEVAALALQ